MRYVFFVILFSIVLCALPSLSGAWGEAQDICREKSLLVAVLMVKNEASVICQTLQPLVDAGIDSFFIFDTGSTDGTPEVVKKYFEHNKIEQGYIAQEPFVNFEVSRNRALELAERQFSTADFVLMLDAEWYLENADRLVSFCREHRDDTLDAYLLRICTDPDDFFSPRLMRPRAHLRYVGAVHEYLMVDVVGKLPAEICFEVKQSEQGELATKSRMLRDFAILSQEHEKNPYDVRTLYFLAQTLVHLGDFRQAYRCYRLCVQYNNNQTEKSWEGYQSCYNSGMLVEQLSKEDVSYQWPLALEHYLEAFSLCPFRAEPLVKIARHYWDDGNIELCYLFAYRAVEIPFPHHLIDPVDRNVYFFDRYDLLGAAASVLGKFSLGKWALSQALESQPHNENIQHNLNVLERKCINGFQQPSLVQHYSSQ